ncbi:Fc receptor-like protein 4 [Suncus etruscus]|uniref:Fc receptor-like protein 4 n=1 Tax=Suncus etruscus TaxID=109475 RepID=UPI00210F3340|nr:Fc receptor-like protein 4 [Suncus etruscus]
MGTTKSSVFSQPLDISLLISPQPTSSAAQQSVIFLNPPWTTFFQGERVNMTCHGSHDYVAGETSKYHWYHGKKTHVATGKTLQVRVSGQYKCQAPGSLQSKPVNLLFSKESLILQAPSSVFEGDRLLLRCKKRAREKLTAVQYTYYGKSISIPNNISDLLIPQASSKHNGRYQCSGTMNKYKFKSNAKIIKIQELFTLPTLKITAFQPEEGSSVTLSCEVQLPLERRNTLLHFMFFRENEVILSEWSSSPEHQIATIWKEDSGAYKCGVETVNDSILKYSPPRQIHVQRIPVSGALLETRPQKAHAFQGKTLVLVCSVANGTGITTFFWYREDTKESLGRKSGRFQRAELETPVKSHSGSYYCTADNGYGPIHSVPVNVTISASLPLTQGLKDELPTSRKQCSCPHPQPSSRGGLMIPNHLLSLVPDLVFRAKLRKDPRYNLLLLELKTPPTSSAPPATCSASLELQLLDSNAQPKKEDLVYSKVQMIHLKEENGPDRAPQSTFWVRFLHLLAIFCVWWRCCERTGGGKRGPGSLEMKKLEMEPGRPAACKGNTKFVCGNSTAQLHSGVLRVRSYLKILASCFSPQYPTSAKATSRCRPNAEEHQGRRKMQFGAQLTPALQLQPFLGCLAVSL